MYWMARRDARRIHQLREQSRAKRALRSRDATATRAAVSSGQTQGLTVRRFDLAPGPLSIGSCRLREMRPIKVIVPNDAMNDLTSLGVSGLYTPETALRKLLSGTGISLSLTAPGTATLEIEKVSAVVEVTSTTLQDTPPEINPAADGHSAVH